MSIKTALGATEMRKSFVSRKKIVKPEKMFYQQDFWS